MFKTEPALRRNFYAVVVIFLVICLSKNDLKGQDIHYSQFYNSPLNINPALTGVFNGDVRVIGSLRDQWRPIPVPYLTFSGNYDMKINSKNSDKGFFGVGAIFNYDRSGDGGYNISDLNVLGSYSYLLNKRNVLSAGILLGLASEGFSGDALSWDAQWTGEVYNEKLSSNEPLDANPRVTYLETGVGLNYRYQKSSRTNLDLGVGAWHLNTPNISYTNDPDSDLPMRIALNARGLFKIANPVDIQLHGNHNIQGPYTETVVGGLVRLHIKQSTFTNYALDLGASYRTSGFLIPTIALHYNQWYIGGSYDINLIPFQERHDENLGGPEVHVRYIIANVKSPSEKKACPIF